MAIVNSRAAIEPKTGKAAIFVNETIHSLIRKLFANNEQGFAYDPNDLSTMYQDAAGTVPVTGAGQPVGSVLDKSKGLVLGPELWKSNGVNEYNGWSNNIDGSFYHIPGTSGSVEAVNKPNVVIGGWYYIDFLLEGATAGGARIITGSLVSERTSSNGKYRFLLGPLTSTGIFFNANSEFNGTIKNVSIKRLTGNHAYQTTSAARPILQNAPRRIDFDAVDDKLITTLPTQLTGCTVVRSVPNVGTQILTNQTIPATYNDNTDHCGLIVINRALTATETSQITKLFNKAAGV